MGHEKQVSFQEVTPFRSVLHPKSKETTVLIYLAVR